MPCSASLIKTIHLYSSCYIHIAMIYGMLIYYKAKDNKARTLLNHTLFGRLVLKKYKNKKIYYYHKGLLHEIKFCTISKSKIFVYDNNLNIDILKIFGTVETKKIELNMDINKLQTGKEHWYTIGKKKELNIRDGRKSK